MPRELRISAVITLPDDKWQEAAALVEAKPLLDRLRTDFPNATIEDEIVTPKPRGAKADEPIVMQQGGTGRGLPPVTVKIVEAEAELIPRFGGSTIS